MDTLYIITPLLLGWLLDKMIGDPEKLPHLIVGFGRLISFGEKRLNKGNSRKLKGALLSLLLILGIYFSSRYLMNLCSELHLYLYIVVGTVCVYYCLAGTTLVKEVRMVFKATDRSLNEGRKQVARIVGRDTSALNAQQIRTAALETLAENLSDGVIAPLFWYLLLGVPGMLAYKMINTLDSMIGYKNERYMKFGCIAAKVDDVANYIPARLTAFLMVAASGNWSLLSFVKRYGSKHASPNSGYPESALAGILNCRFGGPNYYFGKVVEKPYIGSNERELVTADMERATSINVKSESMMILLMIVLFSLAPSVIKSLF